MLKLILTCLLGWCLLLGAFVETNTCIEWSPTRKLTWKDFSGILPVMPDHSAYTFVKNSYSTKIIGDSMDIIVSTCFQKDKSWAVSKDTSSYLLNHEQRHFDMAEIYARKFKIYALGWDRKDFLSNYLSDGLKTINDSLIAMHTAYDIETNHSRNTVAQCKWDRKIDSLLHFYDAYSHKMIRVSRR